MRQYVQKAKEFVKAKVHTAGVKLVLRKSHLLRLGVNILYDELIKVQSIHEAVGVIWMGLWSYKHTGIACLHIHHIYPQQYYKVGRHVRWHVFSLNEGKEGREIKVTVYVFLMHQQQLGIHSYEFPYYQKLVNVGLTKI